MNELTTQQALKLAAELGAKITRATLWHWQKVGQLDGRQLGGAGGPWLWNRESLLARLEKRRLEEPVDEASEIRDALDAALAPYLPENVPETKEAECTNPPNSATPLPRSSSAATCPE